MLERPDNHGLDSISFQLGNISGQLAALTAAVNQNQRETTRRLDAAEQDIEDLKTSRARYLGMATGIASVVSAVAAAVSSFLFK